MKLFLLGLSVLFLLSCDFSPREEEGDEKDQIESIKDQIDTALEEIKTFQKEIQALKKYFINVTNANNPRPDFDDTLTKINSLETFIPSLIELVNQASIVVEKAADQVESAINEEQLKQAVQQAVSAKDKVISYKNQAEEEILNEVKTLVGVSD